MNPRLCSAPCVEQLEDRWMPAVTSVFNGTTLTLGGGTAQGGTPAFNGGNRLLQINVNADGTIDAGDGTSTTNLANDVPASQIVIRLSNFAAETQINTNGFTFSGSISYQAGNGSDTVTLLGDGSISGNLSITTGTGADSISIPDSASVGSSVTVNSGTGDDTFTMGNADIGGNLTLQGVNRADLNSATLTAHRIGGSVAISTGTEQQINQWDIGDELTIGGNLSVTSQKPTFNAPSNTVGINGVVEGNVILNLGSAPNDVSLGSTSAAQVQGNFYVITGAGADFITFNALSEIGGNVLLSLGDNSNTFIFDDEAVILGTSVTYIGGNNDDNLFLNGQAGGARMTALLGAGDDFLAWGDGLGAMAVNFLSAYLDGGFGTNQLMLNDPTPVPFVFKNFTI